ncbi:MAG: 16S rRNA (cytidine(1402)-2'-O)-methyltransferase [Deltaproteobacteria bacterium]|nr:16S rRNA (cytidine(1402)-2'-O)-methyltransferase [Deltaproteobacteria bacterium]
MATNKQECSLYLVATPIGNLEDVTLRALRLLSEVELVAAEDTRHTRKLLAFHGIKAQLISYREQNHKIAAGKIIKVLKNGSDVALVSDAGTPGLSDPGQNLVRQVLDAGMRVVPVPGPAAAVAALTASGLPSDRFVFLGFLPRKKGALQKLAEELAGQAGSLVIYESAKRLGKTLAVLNEIWGPREAVVVRELTKLYETFDRGTLDELAKRYEKPPKGEITLVVAGSENKNTCLPSEWQKLIEALRDGHNLTPSKIAGLIGKLSGLGRKAVYEMLLSRNKQSPDKGEFPR